MKKRIISIAFAALLISGSQTLSTNVQAETMDSISIEKLEDGSILGGWIEGEPSVEEESIESIESSITTLARSSSPTHYGGKDRDLLKRLNRAWARTYWDRYHYSRAQMVASNGSVVADSGREWDSGVTRAYSPWVSNIYSALSFYGS